MVEGFPSLAGLNPAQPESLSLTSGIGMATVLGLRLRNTVGTHQPARHRLTARDVRAAVPTFVLLFLPPPSCARSATRQHVGRLSSSPSDCVPPM